MMIVDWANITIVALQDTWQAIVLYLPKLFGAIVVFVIGWLIGSFVGKLIAEILKKITFNKLFENYNYGETYFLFYAINTVMAFIAKNRFGFWINRIYLAGILRFALAVVFLVGASRCRYPKVIIAFGIAFIISGVVVFAVRLEKLKSILRWWGKQPAIILRILGLLTIIIGAAVLYCA